MARVFQEIIILKYKKFNIKKMKSLNQYIIEKILINKSSKFNKIKVESQDKLLSIIRDRYNNNKSFLDLTDLDISELNNLSSMFFELYSMEVVDISGWDTSNVTTMENMFSFCDKLKNIIGIENFDVSKLESAHSMFYCCKNLVELDLTNWNPKLLQKTRYMFYGCSNLKIIKNIENWQLPNIKDVNHMFSDCTKLDVDLSNWDFTKIKDSLKAGIIDDSGITETHYPKI